MSHSKRTAITLMPHDGQVRTAVAMAKMAEDAGYDDLWFADTGCPDALTMAPLIAQATSKVRIGTAVIPVFTRSAAVLAATAQTIQQVADGRFILGIGTSSQVMMEGWHGQTFEKPLSRMRDTTRLMKSIFKGEKTDFDGKTIHSHGYRQAPGDTPIYLAGLKPKMVEMAAQEADGVILNLFPAPALDKIIGHVRNGEAAGGKQAGDAEVVCRHQVMVTDDKKAALDLLRKAFIPYYATPVYNAFLEWCGYEEEARLIAEGWASKDREKTAKGLHDDLLDQIMIVGSQAECQERIRQYADQGIHTHIITCMAPDQGIQAATLGAFAKNQFSF